ncbi:MAG: response regulator [Acetobacteraceae bacterium]|nr:response regulator [Acetobacteraceae bacterium]
MEIPDETVIVADNDSMMRGLLRTALERPRRTLLLCADGSEAVELAAQTLATLVLLDLRMPRMDGIEACRLIRDLPRYETVPIVILTVFDGEVLRRRAIRAGATFFLGKPFSRDQLMRTITPLIEAQKQTMEPECY